MPLISVVLPVYNSEKYISEAVQSILNQTLPDFELIIINDASTDGTVQALKRFTDKRIWLVNNEVNLGLVKTLNKGLDLATGEFIARMDADDVAHPLRFQKQIDYLRRHTDVDVCGTWAYTFGSNNYVRQPAEKHENIKAHLLFINEIIHPTLMIRRGSLLHHNGRFNEAFVKCEDYELWINLIDKMKFATLPGVLLSYRIHNNNYSVITKANNSLLKKWNIASQQILLKRAGVCFAEKDLELHYKICFKDNISLSATEFKECILWLKKIIAANNDSSFFNKQALCNEIIEQVILLNRNSVKPISKTGLLMNEIIPMFSLVMVIRYIPLKIVKSINFYKNAALVKRVGNKPFTQ